MDVEVFQMFFRHLLRWSFVLCFSFVDGVYHVDWLAYVETTLWHWDESNLVMVYDPLMCCQFRFSNIQSRIFASIFIKDIGLQFSFLVVSSSVFFVKVFIEFVPILLLFYVLVSCLWGMWDLSFKTRDRTCTPCTGRQNLNCWTTRKVPTCFILFF